MEMGTGGAAVDGRTYVLFLASPLLYTIQCHIFKQNLASVYVRKLLRREILKFVGARNYVDINCIQVSSYWYRRS